MKKVRVYDTTANVILVQEAELADTFFSRWRGLMGRSGLQDGEGLILHPCNSIHTIGMRFSIDVIFLDQSEKVCHMIRNMKPIRLSPIIFRAKKVLEMKGGTLQKFQIEKGDILEFQAI